MVATSSYDVFFSDVSPDFQRHSRPNQQSLKQHLIPLSQTFHFEYLQLGENLVQILPKSPLSRRC